MKERLPLITSFMFYKRVLDKIKFYYEEYFMVVTRGQLETFYVN